MSGTAKIFLFVLAGLTIAVGAVYVGTRVTREPSPTPEETSPTVSPEPTETLEDDDTDPEPGAPPGETPAPPAPAEEGVTIWNGPDEAVATWFSESCNRDVLRFGAQQYQQGRSVNEVPPNVSYLGYHLGDRRLWGDRGAPSVLYVTSDGGATFREWLATDQRC